MLYNVGYPSDAVNLLSKLCIKKLTLSSSFSWDSTTVHYQNWALDSMDLCNLVNLGIGLNV